jgi:uncharacterized protein (TIGR03067 family)
VDKTLPARANLDHLRGQAKKLLAGFAAGDADAIRAFSEHLPAARDVAPSKLRATKLKLSDAQSVIARQAGFASWPVLVRHVEQLRSLEGEWQIARLEVDGNEVPQAMLGASRILIDGDRFRTESPGGNYEGIFTIDTESDPPHFDIHFVAGPEAGNDSLGIFRIDGPDDFTLCLGLVHASRPKSFATSAGSGHALERLQRTSKARPENVRGGTPPPPRPSAPRGDAATFEVALTPIYQALQGEWSAVELVADGKRMEGAWLAYGARTMTGNETKVVFGGQTMVHAKVRIDDTQTPIAIDYLSLLAKTAGAITYGIMELVGDEVRFLMAPPGAPRPTSFEVPGTLSRWRRR